MTISKILYHPITILSLTIISILFFVQLDKNGKKSQNSSENIKILENEVNSISKNIITIEEEINEADSQQFKEKVVRNELLMQKPGEYVLIIPEIEASEVQPDCISRTCANISNNSGDTPADAWMKLVF